MAEDIANLMFAASQKFADQQFPDLKQMATLASLNQRTELERQKAADLAQNRNTLAQVFSNPANFDEKTNMLNTQGLGGLRAAPSAYLDYLPMAAKAKHNQVLEAGQNAKLTQSWVDANAQNEKRALAAYDQNVKTLGPEGAAAQFQADVLQGRNDMKAGGAYGDLMDRFEGQPPPDPMRSRTNVMAWDAARIKPATAHELATEQHQKVTEGQRDTELGIQKGRAADASDKGAADLALKGYQPFTDPDSGEMVWKAPGKPDLAGGKVSGKVGTASQSVDAQLLDKYRKENPGSTAADDAAFKRSLGTVRSANAMATQKFIEENPGATAADINAFDAKRRQMSTAFVDFGTKVQGKSITSFNTAVHHLDLLDEYGKALANNEVQVINQLKNGVATAIGKPAPTDFNAIKEIVGDEIVKAVLGSGNGALGDRDAIKANINAKQSPEQLSGAINDYQRLMGGQLASIRQQYRALGLEPLQPFDDRLFPRTKQVLEAEAQAAENAGTAKAAPAAPAAEVKAGAERTWQGKTYRFKGGDQYDQKNWEAVK